MPNRGIVKQKSNKSAKLKRIGKTKTKSPFENTRPSGSKQREDSSSEDEDNHEEEEEAGEEQRIEEDDDSPKKEKDDTEKQLEKLLFGDDQGFHHALRDRGELELLHQSDDEEMVNGDHRGDRDGNDNDDDDKALEDVPDSEVSVAYIYFARSSY